MNVRIILLALAASAAASSGALAASSGIGSGGDVGKPSIRDTADRCSALETQYNALVGKMSDAKKFDKASGLASAGISDCQANETARGTAKLEHALKTLGVTPAA
jgi:hypothetical protein